MACGNRRAVVSGGLKPTLRQSRGRHEAVAWASARASHSPLATAVQGISRQDVTSIASTIPDAVDKTVAWALARATYAPQALEAHFFRSATFTSYRRWVVVNGVGSGPRYIWGEFPGLKPRLRFGGAARAGMTPRTITVAWALARASYVPQALEAHFFRSATFTSYRRWVVVNGVGSGPGYIWGEFPGLKPRLRFWGATRAKAQATVWGCRRAKAQATLFGGAAGLKPRLRFLGVPPGLKPRLRFWGATRAKAEATFLGVPPGLKPTLRFWGCHPG